MKTSAKSLSARLELKTTPQRQLVDALRTALSEFADEDQSIACPPVETPDTLPNGFGQLTALIIGNSDYRPAGPDRNDLPGVLLDVANWSGIVPGLAEVQKYACIDLKVLNDATGKQMRAAIADLLDPDLKSCAQMETGPAAELSNGVVIRDTRVLVYSGHGGGVRDLDGDERTGIDAALLGIDVEGDRPDPNVTALLKPDGTATDDYVSGLARAVNPIAGLYFVYDCCYNGDASRIFEPNLPARFRPRARTLSDFVPRERTADFGPDRMSSGRGVWLEAARWNQLARELRGLGGVYTNAVTDLLTANPSATPQEMTDRATTAASVYDNHPRGPQKPQLEDLENLGNLPFLRGKVAV